MSLTTEETGQGGIAASQHALLAPKLRSADELRMVLRESDTILISARGRRTRCSGMSQSKPDQLSLYAAGSLRVALGSVAGYFEETSGIHVETTFGPSHILRERIEAGERPDVFASANMLHPELLTKAKLAGPTVAFAHTSICALVRPDAEVSPDTLLSYILDPATRVGTGTPGGDPLGDYTWRVFERAEQARAGSFEVLSGKALQLFGGESRPLPLPEGRHPIVYFLSESRDIDVFFVYCANGGAVLDMAPHLRLLALPQELAVPATFGLTVVSQPSEAANRFAFTVLSPKGQEILADRSFEAPLRFDEG